MDGLDISGFSQVDEEIFRGTPGSSDEEDETLPLPDCVGLDSALQDEEKKRESNKPKQKTRSETERELEVAMLNPNSIRREILERSIKSGNNNACLPSTSGRNHVMNIVEKAGMEGIDKEHINEIIHKASEGSLFYKRQAQRQEEIHRSIEKMLTKVKNATPQQVANAQIICNSMLKELEDQREFNKIIVHFDLDMFFAAVEIRDNPSLADKPVAVGGDSMVSTSNYIARKCGVRAAMPGFIAKKLCPDLVLIKPNGAKYREASSYVFDVLEQYDPDLASMSLDEAYLDLTEYIKQRLESKEVEFQEYYDGTLPEIWWTQADEVVKEIREAIYEKTSLTCSAGIACNTMLSKIATDINKPNGQFMIKGCHKDVDDFIRGTPVEKVSGIGKVSAQFLNALDIKTCGDIYEKRHFLPLVFYPVNIRFYLKVAIGDGSTKLQNDDQRKSKSIEQTFGAIKDPTLLVERLDKMCEELCAKFLKPYRIRGRTVTVKLKRSTFSTLTRAYSLLISTNDKEVIFKAAKNLLLAELKTAGPNVSYRLLGVRLSNLADEGVAQNQMTIDAMLRNQEASVNLKNSTSKSNHSDSGDASLQICDSSKQLLDCKSALDREVSQDSTSQGLNLDTQEVNSVELPSELEEPAPKRAEKSKRKLSTRKIEDFLINKNLTSEGSQQFQSQFELGESQKEQQPFLAQENGDDFMCPFCFKKFQDFDPLEAHVSSTCTQKTFASDPYDKASQMSVVKSTLSTPQSVKSSQRNFDDITLLHTPTATTKINNDKKPKKQLKISNLFIASQSPSTVTTPNSNKPYYETFMEHNSQVFTQTQSPKFEPLPCPYCFHLFKNFDLLESHVRICTKNKSG